MMQKNLQLANWIRITHSSPKSEHCKDVWEGGSEDAKLKDLAESNKKDMENIINVQSDAESDGNYQMKRNQNLSDSVELKKKLSGMNGNDIEKIEQEESSTNNKSSSNDGNRQPELLEFVVNFKLLQRYVDQKLSQDHSVHSAKINKGFLSATRCLRTLWMIASSNSIPPKEEDGGRSLNLEAIHQNANEEIRRVLEG